MYVHHCSLLFDNPKQTVRWGPTALSRLFCCAGAAAVGLQTPWSSLSEWDALAELAVSIRPARELDCLPALVVVTPRSAVDFWNFRVREFALFWHGTLPSGPAIAGVCDRPVCQKR